MSYDVISRSWDRSYEEIKALDVERGKKRGRERAIHVSLRL